MVKRGKSSFIKINHEDIILSKKGLSNIIAILLLILLVIVVAGIMWVVVKNVIQESSESVELGRFTLDLQIERAQIEDGDVTVVVVRRNPGKGDFMGMNFIFYDGENTEIIKEYTILKETEVRSFTFTLTQISTSNLKKISVSPIFRLSSGKESVGDVTSSMEIKEGMWVGAGESEQTPFELLGFKGMGTVDYTLSGGQGHINFTRAIVDPLDVLPGDNQTFTVHITSTYSIINVTSFTQLDNSNSTLIFEKISEDEIWSISWIVDDVHATTYRTNITATDSEGNSNSIALTWTDSCQSLVTHGQNLILDKECSTTPYFLGGLDGGNLTINPDGALILSMSSTWVFNDGKAIIMGGGYIGFDTAASIMKANLYVRDEDGDGYGLPNVTSTTGGAGWIRASAANVTPDCYDKNASAYPGATAWRTVTRGTSGTGNDAAGNTWNSFDYNCDGNEQKFYGDQLGQCQACDWDGEFSFCFSLGGPGQDGWMGSNPGCGNSSDYIQQPGMTCAGLFEWECTVASDCWWESVTEMCR